MTVPSTDDGALLPQDLILADHQVRLVRTDIPVVQMFSVVSGEVDRWLATAFRLDKATPVIRTNYLERDWLVPNCGYLTAEASYFLEHQMTRPLVKVGERILAGVTVRIYRERYSTEPVLWFKQVKPEPEVGLGYAEQLDSAQPRFQALNSVWSDALRAEAVALGSSPLGGDTDLNGWLNGSELLFVLDR